MKKILFKSTAVITVLGFAVCGCPYSLVLAQEEDDIMQASGEQMLKEEEVVDLITGEVVTIDTKNLSRVAVANPDIVDISDAKADKVFISGKRAGLSEVFIWDDAGKRNVVVRVALEKLDSVESRVREVIQKAGIKGVLLEKNQAEGKVVLHGSIPKKDKDLLDKIMDPYIERTINLVNVETIEDSVQIDAQIIELNTDLEKSIGIEWFTGEQTLDTATGQFTTESNGRLIPTYLEAAPSTNGKPEDFFKVGKFFRSQESALGAKINALLTEGKARVISKPRLVVMSGKEASFLVGGELPIRTTTTSAAGGQSQETVTFKQYGVSMTITPIIRDGKIDLLLNVKISDIDRATVNPSGDFGYITRQAQTQVFLEDKQTIVLAGLIKHNDNESIKKVPFFGNIPVVGTLFTSRDKPVKDTELVITLTANIIKDVKKITEQVVLPSKRAEKYNKDIESNFEKEPVVSAKAKEEPKQMMPVVIEELKTVVLAPAKVPEMVSMAYMRNVQLKISEAINYPYEALRQNWQGTVKLRLRILKNGSLADCDLLESSGYDVFDSDAISATRNQAPFLPFPQEMTQDDVVVTVPIVYNQKEVKRNSQTVVASY